MSVPITIRVTTPAFLAWKFNEKQVVFFVIRTWLCDFDNSIISEAPVIRKSWKVKFLISGDFSTLTIALISSPTIPFKVFSFPINDTYWFEGLEWPD